MANQIQVLKPMDCMDTNPQFEKKQTISSVEIATLTGKQHAHVMRDIRALLEQGVSESNFGLSSYKQRQPNGGEKEVACYQLTKKGCLILASGYNALLREKIISRWEQLEIAARNNPPALPQNYKEALAHLLLQVEENEKLQLENETKQKQIEVQTTVIAQKDREISTLRERTDYLDQILASRAKVVTSQIAADYGMSAVKLNKKLCELGVQRKVNGQWLLYGKHQGKGYTSSDTVPIVHRDGRPDFVMHTTWTQKGRLFLYQILKKRGILPMIERVA